MEAIKNAYAKLVAAKEFEKVGFLCSVFMMVNPKEVGTQDWQFDFYNEEKDLITSYTVGDEIKLLNKDVEVFHEKKEKVEELVLDEVTVNFADAFDLLNMRLKAKHELPTRFIIVLQKLKVPVWNVSALTDTFNLVNMRVDAQTKEILDEKSFSMLSWKA